MTKQEIKNQLQEFNCKFTDSLINVIDECIEELETAGQSNYSNDKLGISITCSTKQENEVFIDLVDIDKSKSVCTITVNFN